MNFDFRKKKDQVARFGVMGAGGSLGDSGNARKKTFFFRWPLPLLRANYLGNLKTKQKQCSIEYYFQEKFFLLLSMTMLKKVTFFQFKLIFFDIRHQCFAWNKTRKSLDVFPKKKLWWSLGNITYRFVDNHIYREHFIGSFWLRLSQLLSILQFHLGGQVFQRLQKASVE